MERHRTFLETFAGFLAATGLLVGCTSSHEEQIVDPSLDESAIPADAPELRELTPAPSSLYPTSDKVHGRACALTVEQITNPALTDSLNQEWELIGALEFGGKQFQAAEDLQAHLLDAPSFETELTTLAYNIHMNEVRMYGRFGSLGSAQLVSAGAYTGLSAKEMVILAQETKSAAIQEAMGMFNEGFGSCVSGTGSTLAFTTFSAVNPDADGDGVSAANDCDDNDVLVGALVYETDFSQDDNFFTQSPTLEGRWVWDQGSESLWVDDGKQQAMIGQPQQWDNVVAFATIGSRGSVDPCGHADGEDPCPTTARWRSGILLRAALDQDQGEGFHGYRCALSSNATNGCYEDGLFLQIGEFMDHPEDSNSSEVCGGDICLPNSAFDQLARQNHTNAVSDLSDEQNAQLKFYAVGNDMYCEAVGPNGEKVSTVATDRSLSSGTVGLSTLNMAGDFDHLKVCEAFGTPASAAEALDWEAELGAHLPLGDDSCIPIELPFPITFYDVTYGPGTKFPRAFANSNGNLTFNGCNTWYAVPQIPFGSRALVGVLFGDFAPNMGGRVHWKVLGTAPARRLMVTYYHVPEFLKGGLNTFQIILFEDSHNIQFAYDILDTDGHNWNPTNGRHPPMQVGTSSGKGRWFRSASGSEIPGLDNHNICYLYDDGIDSYEELRGYCP